MTIKQTGSILLGKSAEALAPVNLDVTNFLKTRLLITANSGGGKSWMIRRIAELLSDYMPVIILDPEGEFKTLREKFPFVLIGPGGEAPADCRSAKLTILKILELRASAVFDLSEMARFEKHNFIKILAEAAIDSPKHLWRDTTFIFDEAHDVCPENGKGQSVARAAVLGFPTKGRKRHFGCIFATQRLAKLAMDARAEMLNRAVGMMFEPDDIAAAAGILGVVDKDERRKFAQNMRTMPEGNFYCFGRAISRETILTQIGPVETSHEVQESVHGVHAPPTPQRIKNLLPQLKDLPQQAEEEARTVDELRAQLAETRAALSAANREQPKLEVKTKIEKERILTPAESKRLTKLVDSIEQLREDRESLKQQADLISGKVDSIRDEIVYFKKVLAPQPAALAAKPAPAPAVVKPVARECITKTIARECVSEQPETDFRLSGSILDILRCIADGGGEGVDDDEIAIMTSLKTTSRNVYKRKLAAAGYIQKGGKGLIVTQAGVDAMGGSWTPLPKGAALREYWLNRLTGGELSLFKLYVEAYPESVTVDELMQKTGLMTTSINVYRRKLKARRLVEDNAAKAALFE